MPGLNTPRNTGCGHICRLVVKVLTTDPEVRVRFPALPEKKEVGLERGPLSLESTTEELLERKSSGSGLENRDYGCRVLPRLSCGTLYLQKLALTSPTSGGRSVGIVCSRTQTTEFVCFFVLFGHI
jgi:hypothetical protein